MTAEHKLKVKIQTSPVYGKIDKYIKEGFTTVSAQGSSRSGKTYNILIWLINYCLNNPKTRLSIVRATLPALRGSVFVDFKDILMDMQIFEDKALNKTEMVYKFPNGSWVEFFSTDSEQKLRGRKRDILFINEANELSFIEFQQLQMRTERFTIIDYNPSFSDDHWICTLNEDPRTKHFITTYKENPFLKQRIVDEIESLQWKNQTLWQVYGLGLRAIIEGLIFKNVTIVDYIPEHVRKRWRGIDFGYSNDPTAICEVGILDNDLYLNEICYRTEMLTSDIIKELNNLEPKLKLISESADPRLVQEIYRAGINIHPVKKFKGSIDAGINKMLEFNIFVTKNSYNAIKELKNYTYQQDKEGKWLNEPIDAYNHLIDSVRYVILEEVLGGVPKPIDLNRLARYAH